MGMNGEADVLGLGAHLDRQRRLRDEVAGVGSPQAPAAIPSAGAASERRSPALGPTMPQPMRRWVSSSHRVLVRPSSRPSESDRPLAAHGKTALPYLIPFALASVSVTPAQATSGSV